MLASGRKPVARRADTSRRAEPTNVFQRQQVRPRRALAPVEQARQGRAVQATVGVLATAVLVGGMSMAEAQPAAAKSDRPIGYGWQKLHKGDEGRAVVRLQRELSAYGPNVPDTGYFGKQTKKRVKQLQRRNDWKATGRVGNKVWHELLTDGNRVTSPAMVDHDKPSKGKKKPRLERGDRGKSVKRLQRELTKYGPSVPRTGYFGSQTENRVENLQRRSDMKVTGVATKRVWTKLLNDDNKPYRPGGGDGGDGGGSGGGSNVNNTVWDRLAQCESGGNWHINTGNGFYGGLQFTLQTWRGYGGSGMPHKNSREEQIRVAERVQNAQGWGAWPACSSKLGLR